MSQLRERIALLISTAENQGWHTIVAPTEFMRAAFLDSPQGMEARLRDRALQLRGERVEKLEPSDGALLDEAADMLAALSAPSPEESIGPSDRLRLIRLIDIVDHALLYIPRGEVRDKAHATRVELWRALMEGLVAPKPTEDSAPAARRPSSGLSDVFEIRTSARVVADVLRDVLAAKQAPGDVPQEEAIDIAAEQVQALYARDMERLKGERETWKEFESGMINEWLEAHEKAIESERRALRARQRERETVERCARIAEEPVDLPSDARAIRLAVYAVQRHIAAAIRRDPEPQR
jgi:hypothetical protein